MNRTPAYETPPAHGDGDAPPTVTAIADTLARRGCLTITPAAGDAAYLAHPNGDDGDPDASGAATVPIFGSLHAARRHLNRHHELLAGELLVLGWAAPAVAVLTANLIHHQLGLAVDLDDGNRLVRVPVPELHAELAGRLGEPDPNSVASPQAAFAVASGPAGARLERLHTDADPDEKPAAAP